MNKQIVILTGEPTIEVIAEMKIDWPGIGKMGNWVQSHRPECLPDEWPLGGNSQLFPHGAGPGGLNKDISDNELLVELAGRKCYDSFGLKAGKKTNAEYIANTQAGDVPHASILYHAKMSFFIAGVSRRVSHELIRNYVGADRDEEGSPSQESTRFTHHHGYYIAPPRILGGSQEGDSSESLNSLEGEQFKVAMQNNYNAYLGFIERQFKIFGGNPKGMDRKRIYEAASSYLSHACETSFVWTTNPMALAKLFRERDNEFADAEFQRFAKKWKRICLERWLGLFPQPWMQPQKAALGGAT